MRRAVVYSRCTPRKLPHQAKRLGTIVSAPLFFSVETGRALALALRLSGASPYQGIAATNHYSPITNHFSRLATYDSAVAHSALVVGLWS